MKEKELNILIQKCQKQHAPSQRKLYNQYYNYGMGIASRYSNSRQETEEIANDGFVKLFKGIHKYRREIPFQVWLRTIFISCGIDHYRKYKNQKVKYLHPQETQRNTGDDNMDSEYLLHMIRKLSSQYRMVFVLHVIEGYTHEEIAKELNISKGTSKSNLSKARSNLKKMIKVHTLESIGYGR